MGEDGKAAAASKIVPERLDRAAPHHYGPRNL